MAWIKPTTIRASLVLCLTLASTWASEPGRCTAQADPAAVWVSSWAKSYGGASYDYPNDLLPLADGGAIVVGYSGSFSVSVDAWAMALDRSGGVGWRKSYGGSAWDEWSDIAALPGGGYLVTGNTKSYGAGNYDLWVAQLDSSGDLQWQKSFGGSGADVAHVVIPTASGAFVLGTTYSATPGTGQLWVLSLNTTGASNWQKVYGTSDGAVDAVAAAEGGLWVLDGSGSSGGFLSTVLLRLDAAGTILWQRVYAGDSNSIFTPTSLALTPDGGAVIAGYAGTYPSNIYDAWVLKVDSSGATQWQFTYGGSGDDQARAIVPIGANAYRVVGYTMSYGSGGMDLWLLSLDAAGAVTRQHALGGANAEYGATAGLSPDYSLLVGGYSGTFTAGSNDTWILKLGLDGLPGAGCDLDTPTTAVAIPGVAGSAPSALSVASANLGSTTTLASATDITLVVANQCLGPELAPMLFLPELQR